MLPDMINVANFGWICVNAVLNVSYYRILILGSLPELVENIHILVRDFISQFMIDLIRMADVFWRHWEGRM
jgi:hypothetical protein